MDLRFEKVTRKATAKTNFEKFVNCIIPASCDLSSDSEDEEERKNFTLEDLFDCFKEASSNGVKLELKAGASRV
jgi:hypothetical protein